MAHDQFVMEQGSIGFERNPRKRAVSGGIAARIFHRAYDMLLLIAGNILPNERVHQQPRGPQSLGAAQLLLDKIGGVHAHQFGRLRTGSGDCRFETDEAYRIVGPDIGFQPIGLFIIA